ncbi:MAG: GxxExxY protein [Anaerolineae bacterium]
MYYKHTAVTQCIIKAFYTVYNTLGYGFAEKVYRNAMALELRKLGVPVAVEFPIQVYYKGEVVGEYFADLVVADAVVVELKAAREFAEAHEAQLLNYLKATRYEVGLLMNFGPKPEFVRKAYDNDRKGSLSWIEDSQDADER